MTGGPGFDGYLSEVAAALPGPARARDDIIAELRSGLLDATDAYQAAGRSPDEAAATATAEFGDPRQIAASFGPELAAHQARRLALTLITSGPLVGLLWTAAATASHVGIRHAPPWQWRGMPPASLITVPMFGAVLLTFVCAAVFTLAATGPLTRWLPAGPRTAPAAAAIAGFAAAAADLAAFILLASKLASAPATLAPAPVLAAAVASLARLTLARRAARRCLTARAALSRA
jgi:HAAS